ncbi:MAG: hypothetical protein AAB468_02825 [Patescibacteria group bacterium]
MLTQIIATKSLDQFRRRVELAVEQVYRVRIDELQANHLDIRDLLRHALLHVPKLTSVERRRSSVLRSEIDRLAGMLLADRLLIPRSLFDLSAATVPLDDLDLAPVSAELTVALLSRFHYLRHPRDYVQSVGLFPSNGHPNAIAALFTVSRMDLDHVMRLLPSGIDASQVQVLSRVYASPFAPRNTVSYGLGLLVARLRTESPHVRALITYINPNLGFDGASLRASNWRLLCRETRRCYYYLDGNYITERECVKSFGTDDFTALKMRLSVHITRSRMRLEPLQIYVHFFRKRDKFKTLDFPDRTIEPEPVNRCSSS